MGGSDGVAHGIADAIAHVLPVAAAKHLVVASLVPEYERPLDGMPAYAALFNASWIVHLPVVARARHWPRLPGQRTEIEHPVAHRAGANMAVFQKIGGVEQIPCAIFVHKHMAVNRERLGGQPHPAVDERPGRMLGDRTGRDLLARRHR